MYISIVLALLLAGCAAWPQVDAQRCASHQHMTELLTLQYGERVAARGLGLGGMIELYTTVESFTIIRVLPTGVSCIVTMGSKWIKVRQPARGMHL